MTAGPRERGSGPGVEADRRGAGAGSCLHVRPMRRAQRMVTGRNRRASSGWRSDVAAAQPNLSRRLASRWPARAWVAAALLAAAVQGCGGPSPAGPQTTPPESRTPVPREVQRDVHARLHRLPATCGRQVDRWAVERTTRRFIRYYERYPSARYRMQIDDEAGTTLSAILVLRHELARCSPRSARPIDEILPPRVRRALRPLERDRR
jgi:hypothetical protein